MKHSNLLRRPTLIASRATTIAMAMAGLLSLAALLGFRLYRAHQSSPLLLPKQQVLQKLAGNRPSTYRIKLNSGQYLKLLIEEPSGRTLATLRAPDRGKLAEFRSLPGATVTVCLIAEKSGEYHLELRLQGQESVAKSCFIRVEEVRQATPRDRRLVAAAEYFLKAGQLRAEWKAELSRKAIEYYDAAQKELQSAEEWVDAALALMSIGEVYHSLGQPLKASEYYRQSLPLCMSAGDVTCQINAFNGMAQTLIQSGDLVNAREACSKAERLSRSTNYVRGLAMAINSLGKLSAASGDPRAAMAHYSEALQYWSGTSDLRGPAQTHLNIGLANFDLGDLQRVRSEYQQALDLWLAAGDRRGEAQTMIYLGHLYSMRAEKQEALGMYEQAGRLLRPIGDKVSEASLLSGMAYLYDEFGDWEKALRYRKEQLSLFREVNFRLEHAVALRQVGELTHSLGRSQEALEYLRQARSIFIEMKDRRLEAHVLRDIGVIYESLGRTALALAFYKRARSLSHAQGDRRWEALALNNTGEIHRRLGKPRLALIDLEKALRLSRVAEDRAGESLTQFNLAHLKRGLGRLAEARAHIEASLDLIELLRARVASTELRTTLVAAVRQRYEFYVALLMQMHGRHPASSNDALALQASERARARSLLDLLGEARADIHQGVSPELLDQRRDLQQQLNAEAERLMRKAGGGNEAATIKVNVNMLLTKLQEVDTQIRSSSPQYAAMVLPQPLSVKEIQQQVLDDNTLLLEYALGSERSYLWAVTRTSLKNYELPSRAEIEKVARPVYDLLAPPQLTPSQPEKQREAEYWRQASALSRMLLKPVAHQLGNKRLLVVADGVLQYIPFAALPIPERARAGDKGTVRGGDKGTRGIRNPQSAIRNPQSVPLIVEHEVVNLPSASTLAVLRRETAGRRPAPKAVAALADPVFETDDMRVFAASGKVKGAPDKQAPNQMAASLPLPLTRLRGMKRDGGFGRLPATLNEARAIEEVTTESERLIAKGFDASRARATDPVLSQYRIIHFATHGILDRENPELSAIVLSLVDRQGRSQDGYLRLHDIYNLNLPAELVVLSACDTGLGKEFKGEGLIGLTRGFMYAGAARVMASLWKVEDEPTAKLMRHFYRHMLKDGLPPAAALRQAQIALWQDAEWRAPYFWAAFVIQGEWR